MAGRLVKIALYKTEKQSWPLLQCPYPPLRLSTSLLSSRSICLHVNSWAHGEILSHRHWRKQKNVVEGSGNSGFMCSTVAYCTSGVDKSNHWSKNTPGQLQKKSPWWEWNPPFRLRKMSCHLSGQDPTWWEGSGVALHCDSALLGVLALTTTAALVWFQEREKISKKKDCNWWNENGKDRTVKEKMEEEVERWGHGSALLSSSRKVHWNSCSDPCHLFSCSLVPGAHPSASTVCSTWQKGSRPYQTSNSQERSSTANVHISHENSQHQFWVFPAAQDKVVSAPRWQTCDFYCVCVLLKEKQPKFLADSNGGLITNTALVSE